MVDLQDQGTLKAKGHQAGNSSAGFYDTVDLAKFKLDPGGTILDRKPRVRIMKKDGRLYLNGTFVRRNGLYKYDFAQLYYSPEDQIILIKFHEQSPGKTARIVAWTNDGKSANIRTASFFNHFNIKRDQIAGDYTPYIKATADGQTIFKIDLKDRKEKSL